MAGWISRILAAFGSQRHKPEADVSYDPAKDGEPEGAEAHPGSPPPAPQGQQGPQTRPH